MENSEISKKSSSTILWSLSAICGIAVLLNLFSLIPGGVKIIGFLTILGTAALACFLVPSAVDFVKSLGTAVSEKTAKFFTTGILLEVLGVITCPAYSSDLISIVAFVLLLLAYKDMKVAEALSADVKAGFNLLFIGAIIGVCAAGISLILGWIPVAGDLLTMLANIGLLVMVILGWKKIAAK